jgi:LysM repeat protein
LYDRGAMVGRSRARYLAPIALAAVIAGTYLIVHSGVTSKHATAQSHTAKRPSGRGKYRRVRFYVVQPGDSLTSIATKTGIPLTTLESLNRNIDPNSLQTAQRLRLRR